jgi:hypothetical protein
MKLRVSKPSATGQQFAVVTLLAVSCMLVAAIGVPTSAWAAEPAKKVAKPAAVKPVKKIAPRVSASRAEIKANAAQMAVGIQAAEAALSPAELAIAQLIQVGQVACELGVTINIKADERQPGYFNLESKKFKFRMFPVVSSTGAIRLQDARAGAVWLQLANKSMLMSQKLGSRLADACMNPAQVVVAAEMEKNPPTSLLEPEKAAVAVMPAGLPTASNTTAAPGLPVPVTTAVEPNLASAQRPEPVSTSAAALTTAPDASTPLPQITIQ